MTEERCKACMAPNLQDANLIDLTAIDQHSSITSGRNIQLFCLHNVNIQNSGFIRLDRLLDILHLVLVINVPIFITQIWLQP